MFVNCQQFTRSNTKLRVYNTNPYLIRAVDVYFVCDDPNLASDLLSPDADGNAKFSIVIDGIKHEIQYGLPGDSPTNPIVYKKPISQAKLLFTDRNERNTNKVTAIGGSKDSPLGAEWIQGTNIECDDSIVIEMDFSVIPTRSAQRFGFGDGGFGVTEEIQIGFGGYSNTYVFTSGIIAVEVSQKEVYDFLYRSTVVGGTAWDGGDLGYGESSYGGVMDGGAEGYGGIVI